MNNKVYSNEELSIIVDGHAKAIENNTKAISKVKEDYSEIKSDVKEIKITSTNTNKLVEKLDDEREQRLQAESKEWSGLKVALITAIVTSIGTGIGAFLISKIFN